MKRGRIERQQFWTTVIVAVVVTIITAIITVSIMSGSVGLAPSDKERLRTPSIINANSCNADESCEVSKISFPTAYLEEISLLETRVLRTEALFSEEVLLSEFGVFNRLSVTTENLRSSNGSGVFFDALNGRVNIGGALIAEGIFNMPGMASGNISFACFSPAGTLYRSPTPCI